jgi:hypothetical protein
MRVDIKYTILTVRLPHTAVARFRALAAVTGLLMRDLLLAAFNNYYDRLPAALRREVEQVMHAQKRYRTS